VIDGRSADYRSKRGYLISPWGRLTIDGFRLSDRHAAAFRFSDVPASYAARMGDPRNVGVIGVAIFPERRRPEAPWRRPEPLVAPPPEPQESERRSGLESKARSEADNSLTAPGRTDAAPRLGTEFGEQRDSPVHWVHFERRDPNRPELILGLRYNDRAGLIAAGIRLAPDPPLGPWLSADPFPQRFAAPPPGWHPDL
jgi:hypothetical protein